MKRESPNFSNCGQQAPSQNDHSFSTPSQPQISGGINGEPSQTGEWAQSTLPGLEPICLHYGLSGLPPRISILEMLTFLKEHPELRALLPAQPKDEEPHSKSLGKPLTLKEVQERTGASRNTLHRWRYELPKGMRLEQTKINGFVRVYEAQLEEFQAKQREARK